MILRERVRQIIAEHGSLRAAARALQMDNSYLQRLETGEKTNPSQYILLKLGLVKQHYYRRISTASGPLENVSDNLQLYIRLYGEQCYQDGKVNNEFDTEANKNRYRDLIAAILREL